MRDCGNRSASATTLKGMRSFALFRPGRVRTLARNARCLILALAVGLAQQGALVHAVSHVHEFIRIGAPSTATAVSNPGKTTDEFCLECLAFAQVASAVLGQPLVAPGYESLTTAITLSGREARHAVTVVFLARAPPHLV